MGVANGIGRFQIAMPPPPCNCSCSPAATTRATDRRSAAHPQSFKSETSAQRLSSKMHILSLSKKHSDSHQRPSGCSNIAFTAEVHTCVTATAHTEAKPRHPSTSKMRVHSGRTAGGGDQSEGGGNTATTQACVQKWASR